KSQLNRPLPEFPLKPRNAVDRERVVEAFTSRPHCRPDATETAPRATPLVMALASSSRRSSKPVQLGCEKRGDRGGRQRSDRSQPWWRRVLSPGRGPRCELPPSRRLPRPSPVAAHARPRVELRLGRHVPTPSEFPWLAAAHVHVVTSVR